MAVDFVGDPRLQRNEILSRPAQTPTQHDVVVRQQLIDLPFLVLGDVALDQSSLEGLALVEQVVTPVEGTVALYDLVQALYVFRCQTLFKYAGAGVDHELFVIIIAHTPMLDQAVV